MAALADAGFRACAMDLRGCGASDKPPAGYDAWTSCPDVSGVIRSLGAETAVVLGHGLGGFVAWSLPYFHPGVAQGVGSIGMPHPRVFRREVARTMTQVRANSYLAGIQIPWAPERELTTDPAVVDRMLHRWGAPDGSWPTAEESARYAEAMTIPFAAHAAAEYHRWLVRSQARRDGWRFARKVDGPVRVPVLQIRGAEDETVGAGALGASAAYAGRGLTNVVVPRAGHFPHEEAPAQVNRALLDWVGGVL